jgi:hypothetical protein
MRRTTANFWLDLVSLLVMVGLSLTGGIMHYVLPSGTGNWLTLFGLGRHSYGQIHFCLAVTVVFLLGLHLTLHWSWLCGFVAKSLGKEQPGKRARLLAGAGVVVAVGLLLVGGLAWAASRVEGRFDAGERRRGGSWTGAAPPAIAPRGAPVIPQQLDTVETEPRRGGVVPSQDEENCPAAAAINGQVTIEEAAAVAGLSTTALLRALGVSFPVDPQERLGRLRRRFGFSMQEVRRLACSRP